MEHRLVLIIVFLILTRLTFVVADINQGESKKVKLSNFSSAEFVYDEYDEPTVSDESHGLETTLKDLKMKYPCGPTDYCVVGRHYCNKDTNRCEICNSDVCNGLNADSMCNYLCQAAPTSSPSPPSVHGETMTSVHQDDCDNNWKIGCICSVAVNGLLICAALAIILFMKCHRKNPKHPNGDLKRNFGGHEETQMGDCNNQPQNGRGNDNQQNNTRVEQENQSTILKQVKPQDNNEGKVLPSGQNLT